MRNIIDKLQEQKEFGFVSITPESIFNLDGIHFSTYRELNFHLDTIIKTKADLVTLLYFSKLEYKSSSIFLNNAGISIASIVKSQDFGEQKSKVNEINKNIKNQINYESEEGEGDLLNAMHDKKTFKIRFENYVLQDSKKDTKDIPRDVERQKEYLISLIEQGFFAVQDNYNKWDNKISELFLQLANFSCRGNFKSVRGGQYRKLVLLEAYERGKLSDKVIHFIISSRFSASLSDKYEDNLLKFIFIIRIKYPELTQKIINSIGNYTTTTIKGEWENEYQSSWDFVEGKDNN